jgi:hypothetical protein
MLPQDSGASAANCRVGRNRECPTSLLEGILDFCACLPRDHEVERDLVGTIRTLAALDPAVIDRLSDENARSIPGSARAQVVQAALAALADSARRPDAGGIRPGHDWPSEPFKLGRNYQR